MAITYLEPIPELKGKDAEAFIKQADENAKKQYVLTEAEKKLLKEIRAHASSATKK